MATRVVALQPDSFDADQLKEPAACIREGGLVVFPTETVYGIAVNLDDPSAVKRLLDVRNSPNDKIITLHVASREDAVREALRPVPAAAQRLMRRFWPGPLTIIFPAAKGGTIGIRYPNHRVARELIKQAGVRVGAPSANLAGQPPATDPEPVKRDFEGRVDFILECGPTKFVKPSSVVRVHPDRSDLEVLREGAIPESVIREVGVRTIVFICTGNTCRSPMAEAIFRVMLSEKLGVDAADLEDHGWRILSAGTAAGSGGPASPHSESTARSLGGDLSAHESKPVTVTMIEDADRVFAMTKWHRKVVTEWMPDAAARIDLLCPDGDEIADPIGGDASVYRACAGEIKACLEKRLKELLPS